MYKDKIIEVEVERPARVDFTIRRPGGEVEIVTHPTIKRLISRQFKQIVSDTAKAGRGEVLSYENITETKVEQVVCTAADQAAQSSYEIERMMRFGE